MLAGLCAAVLALVFVSAMCRSEPGADWSDVSALFWESLSADVWDE